MSPPVHLIMPIKPKRIRLEDDHDSRPHRTTVQLILMHNICSHNGHEEPRLWPGTFIKALHVRCLRPRISSSSTSDGLRSACPKLKILFTLSIISFPMFIASIPGRITGLGKVSKELYVRCLNLYLSSIALRRIGCGTSAPTYASVQIGRLMRRVAIVSPHRRFLRH